jgi:hypothetical protein
MTGKTTLSLHCKDQLNHAMINQITNGQRKESQFDLNT